MLMLCSEQPHSLFQLAQTAQTVGFSWPMFGIPECGLHISQHHPNLTIHSRPGKYESEFDQPWLKFVAYILITTCIPLDTIYLQVKTCNLGCMSRREEYLRPNTGQVMVHKIWPTCKVKYVYMGAAPPELCLIKTLVL